MVSICDHFFQKCKLLFFNKVLLYPSSLSRSISKGDSERDSEWDSEGDVEGQGVQYAILLGRLMASS